MKKRLLTATFAAGMVALAASSQALAADKPKPPGSGAAAVAQYVEQIPTSSGPRATGFGRREVRPLPRKVARKLVRQGGRDAPLLKEIATSSTYGAPTRKLKTSKTVKLPTPKEVAEPSPAKTLSAGINVVTDGSDTRLIVLGIVLVLISLLAVASAAVRQRADRR